MQRDGKDKFYRTLNLDDETRKIIRQYRIWKEKAINDQLKEDQNVYNHIQRQYKNDRKRTKGQ